MARKRKASPRSRTRTGARTRGRPRAVGRVRASPTHIGMWHGSTERVRLRLIAILQDRTYKELAPELGFNHETLRRQMLGLSAVSLELVMAVSVLRGVSIEWLLMGRGKP